MMGLGKPKLHTKFKVANVSHCENIEGKPLNIEELHLPRDTPTYTSGCDFMLGHGKSQRYAEREIANISRCGNIKGGPQIFRELLSLGPRPVFFWVGFNGPWQTPAACQTRSRRLYLLRKYNGICLWKLG